MSEMILDIFKNAGYKRLKDEPESIPKPSMELCYFVDDSLVKKECEALPTQVEGSAALTWHLDARGALIELFRRSWDYCPPEANLSPRGLVRQAYISVTNPGVVKAWHLHAEQTDRFFCLRGKVLLGLFSLMDPSSKVRTIVLDSSRSPKLQIIPPGYAHGWKSIGETESWVLNLCSHEYDGTDEWRRPAHSGPSKNVDFDWNQGVDG